MSISNTSTTTLDNIFNTEENRHLARPGYPNSMASAFQATIQFIKQNPSVVALDQAGYFLLGEDRLNLRSDRRSAKYFCRGLRKLSL